MDTNEMSHSAEDEYDGEWEEVHAVGYSKGKAESKSKGKGRGDGGTWKGAAKRLSGKTNRGEAARTAHKSTIRP